MDQTEPAIEMRGNWRQYMLDGVIRQQPAHLVDMSSHQQPQLCTGMYTHLPSNASGATVFLSPIQMMPNTHLMHHPYHQQQKQQHSRRSHHHHHDGRGGAAAAATAATDTNPSSRHK